LHERKQVMFELLAYVVVTVVIDILRSQQGGGQ
jgi:hypothetical protein